MLYLLLLFTVLPLTEFVLLVKIGGEIGLLPTIALVLGTGALGAALARQQGLQTLMRIQQETRAGNMPGDALFDGALILIAGAVLITPGVLTDAMGFSLLIPPLRALVKRGLKRYFSGRVQVHAGGASWSSGQSGLGRGEIVDAEVIETRVEPTSNAEANR